MAQQPNLLIIADHCLNIRQNETLIELCKDLNISEPLQTYLNYEANLANYKDPDIAQELIFQEVNKNKDILFSVNQIDIRISKHLIQFRFPFIYRVFFDYSSLRMAIYQLLIQFLSPFGATQLIAYPTFWNNNDTFIKNSWHEKRLELLQNKIVYECSSFKRTKLNIELCLGNPASDTDAVIGQKYRAWFLTNIL